MSCFDPKPNITIKWSTQNGVRSYFVVKITDPKLKRSEVAKQDDEVVVVALCSSYCCRVVVSKNGATHNESLLQSMEI